MCCSHDINTNREKGTPYPFNPESIKGMRFFDPHVHMISRTTDDYQAMADAGSFQPMAPPAARGRTDHALSR